MTTTLAALLDHHGITVPDETIAEIEVPVLAGPQRQGDVGIFPRSPASTAELADMDDLPAAGL